MLKKLLRVLTGVNTLPPQQMQQYQPFDIQIPPQKPPPPREATRPSYRVGKHKPSDIHKAIDMSG